MAEGPRSLNTIFKKVSDTIFHLQISLNSCSPHGILSTRLGTHSTEQADPFFHTPQPSFPPLPVPVYLHVPTTALQSLSSVPSHRVLAEITR
jgi:hypothetical protein